MSLELNGKSIFDCTTEELHEISDLLKRAWSLQQQKKAAEFHPGDNVSFESRNGETLTGVVNKVNQKTVSVTVGGFRRWKVSASLLSRV
jgi:uncharacterized protein YkvS